MKIFGKMKMKKKQILNKKKLAVAMCLIFTTLSIPAKAETIALPILEKSWNKYEISKTSWALLNSSLSAGNTTITNNYNCNTTSELISAINTTDYYQHKIAWNNVLNRNLTITWLGSLDYLYIKKCAEGKILKMGGSDWECSDDVGTTINQVNSSSYYQIKVNHSNILNMPNYLLASAWNATNTSYYLASNPSGFISSYTETDPKWASNYSAFNASWSNTRNDSYLLKTEWNSTNLSYALKTQIANVSRTNCTGNDKVIGINNITGDPFCGTDQTGSGSALSHLEANFWSSSTKTNIGTSSVAIYPALSGENAHVINFTTCTSFRILFVWDFVGSGTDYIQFKNSTGSVLYSTTTGADADPKDSGWVAIPSGWGSFVGNISMWGNSSVSGNDPIAKGWSLYKMC